MHKRLLTNNKKLQLSKNSSHIGNRINNKTIKQEIIGRFIPLSPSYLDQYLSGAYEMHIHIGWLDRRTIRAGNSIEIGRESIRNYCIILKKLSASSQRLIEPDRLGQITHSKVEEKVLSSTPDSNKLTMLISVFESADNSQDIEMGTNSKIFEMVRLQAYDECSSLRMQALNNSLETIPQLGIIDHEVSISVLSEDVFKQDWKTRFISKPFGGTGNDNIVKRTSQVMYEITKHTGNHGVRLLCDTEASPDFVLAIRPSDASETVRIAACVSQGFLLDVYHVLLSPLNFEPPIKRRI